MSRAERNVIASRYVIF